MVFYFFKTYVSINIRPYTEIKSSRFMTHYSMTSQMTCGKKIFEISQFQYFARIRCFYVKLQNFEFTRKHLLTKSTSPYTRSREG